MKKQIKQFRYYGDNHVKNQPATISANNLASGSIFFEGKLISITRLGIQTIPGVMVYINSPVEPVIIGSTGIYELDLENISEISTLSFNPDSVNFINDASNSAYLVIDAIYNVED